MIRATDNALRAQGIRAESVDAADVLLVDVSDRPSRRVLREVERLRRVDRALVVRVTAAWSAADVTPDVHDPRILDRIIAAADIVLVATRSHLVRLASAHTLDAGRIRLVPAPALLASREVAPSSHLDRTGAHGLAGAGHGGGDRSPLRALIVGDTTPENVEPIGDALRSLDASTLALDVLHPRDVSIDALQQALAHAPGAIIQGGPATVVGLSEGLGRADLVLVPAGSPWGDRSLIETCAFLGRPVVACSEACVIEGPLPNGVVAIGAAPDAQTWAHWLEPALGGGTARPSTLRPPVVGSGPMNAAVSHVDFARRLVETLGEALERRASALGECPRTSAA